MADSPAFRSIAALDPLVVDRPYGGGAPQQETVTGTYAEPGLSLPAQDSVQYPYALRAESPPPHTSWCRAGAGRHRSGGPQLWNWL
ncbi:hypothetical protein [Streptomyces sp. NPDC005533]|uniref:hypothetical protein n=1 Tax=Streptomyces sp. NPDC005533 TaxID=3364723 RepID=UPI00367D5231